MMYLCTTGVLPCAPTCASMCLSSAEYHGFPPGSICNWQSISPYLPLWEDTHPSLLSLPHHMLKTGRPSGHKAAESTRAYISLGPPEARPVPHGNMLLSGIELVV